ncbi:molybdate ABC transporter substrate-binding protein [Nakamurella sp. GG22]
MRRRRSGAVLAVFAGCLVLLAACSTASPSTASSSTASPSTASPNTAPTGSAPAGSASSSDTAATPSGETTLTVFAAASLKKTFTEIGEMFEQQNPGMRVTFSFAGSSDLVSQIIAGAPADVFASADTSNMTKASDADLVAGSPVTFATNTLTIVTPPGNPSGITGFADLARTDLTLVVCAPQVPCGAAAERLETATGVTLTPVSEESSVTDVLNKVTTGEADAGLVYVTDASAAGDKVTAVSFPEATTVVNTYPIAALTGAANQGSATSFVELVSGPDGQRILAAAGFEPAP